MKRVILPLLTIGVYFVLITSCGKKEIPPAIKLSSDTLIVQAGLTKHVSSTDYTADQLSWSSSDTTVATVDNSGLVTALKPGIVNINMTAKAHPVSATCSITVNPGTFTDVSVGADGSIFLVGASTIPTVGGHYVYRYVNGELHKLPDCGALRIAVSPQGVPWVINSQNQILKYTSGAWQQLQGAATDIGIGADGSVYAVSTVVYSPTGGFTVLKWNGTSWDTMTDCSGIHIAVDPHGVPWVINKASIIYQYSGSVLWNAVNGPLANDIGIGANGAIYITAINTGVAGYNPPIYQSSNVGWTQVANDFGTAISVGPTGTIWWIDTLGALHNQ